MTTTTGSDEYGQLYSGGDVLVWNLADELLQVYPLEARINAGRRNGGKVLRRKVIVVEDWSEVVQSA